MAMLPRLAFLLLALAGSAQAFQRVPVIQAGADNRFELELDPKTRITGLNPAQVQRFRQRIDSLTGYLRTLDVLTQPPAPLCMRLSSWLEVGADKVKGAQAIVDAHYPVAFERGRCTQVTGDGVGFYVNHDAPLFDNRYRVSDMDDLGYYRLPLAAHHGRVIHLKGHGFVVTREGSQPWRPANRVSYLRRLIANVEDELARLEQGERDMNELLMKQTGKPFKVRPKELQYRAEQRSYLARLRADLARGDTGEPVCVDAWGVYTGSSCAPDSIIMEANPAYWTGAAPDRIHLLLVRTSAVSKWESKEKEALRMGVFRALDLDQLVDLVEP